MGLVELFDDLCVRFPRFGFWILTEKAKQELYGEFGVKLRDALDDCKKWLVAPPRSEKDILQIESNANHEAARTRFDLLLKEYRRGILEGYFFEKSKQLEENYRVNMGWFSSSSPI